MIRLSIVGIICMAFLTLASICIIAANPLLFLDASQVRSTASVYTWQQPVSGDWQSPSSWAPERTNPASTDILVFNLGGTTTVTNVPTQSIGQLIVSGSTTINLRSATSAILTILGDIGDDLAIASGSALNFDGSNALTANIASGAMGNIFGAITFSSPTSSAHRLTAVDANAITFVNGAVFTAGQGFAGNPFGTTNLNSVIFESGSTYVRLAGEDPFGAAEPASVVVFDHGSLFSLRAPTLFAQSSFYSGRTYANFEYDYPGYSDIEGTSALVMDDLAVRAGQLDFDVNGSPGHSIKGNITVLQGGRLTFQSSFPGHKINLNGNTHQTITVFGNINVNPGNTLVIDNPSGVTITRLFIAWNLELINGVVTVIDPVNYYFRVPGTVTRVNGYINGALSRKIPSLGPLTFDVGTENGYSPVTVEVTGGSDFPGDMVIRTVQTAHPNILYPSKALSRYWQVFSSQNITSADLIFSYLDPTDIPTTTNEADFVIERYTNGFTQPAGVIDTQANTFTATGQGNFYSFTYFTLADPVAAVSPTATSTATASPTATSTPICPPVVLYDQSGSGVTGGVNSQDFDTANDAFDSVAADDFIVPAGQTWTVQKVVVNGLYFNGTGPAESFNLAFYTDAAMFPGSVVAGGTFTGATYTNAAGVFTITLPSTLELSAGTYWVSVQARMDGPSGGQWGWTNRTVTTSSPAAWKNPGGGFNIPACVGWARRGATCMIDPAAPDQVFQLLGTIGVCATPTATATPVAGNISGTVTYGNAIGAPTTRFVSNVLINGAGSVPVSAVSSFPNGTYSLSGFGSGAYTVTPSKTGGAGSAITSFDSALIAKHVAGIQPLAGNQLIVADVSGNGTLSSFDSAQIARYVAGLNNFGSTANWIFTPANRNYASVTGNITGEDFVALLMGDVSGNWTNTGAR